MEQFINDAIEHTEAILNGNYKNANKLHGRLMKHYAEHKSKNALVYYTKYLTHPHEGVRVWAATFLLKINEEVAVKCLQELSKLPSITAFSAKITLDLWRKGQLNLL